MQESQIAFSLPACITLVSMGQSIQQRLEYAFVRLKMTRSFTRPIKL